MSVNTAFETSDLPKAEFMFPGPERDRLVKLILDGVKTATAALMIEYEEEVEPLRALARIRCWWIPMNDP